MTTPINNGQTLSLDTIRSGGLTVNGKPIEFNESEDNPNVYTGVVEFTDEEKESGAKDLLVTFHLNEPVGTVAIYDLLPDSPEFEGLTEAEKFTKLNSYEYQSGKPEPTQIADGSQSNKIGIAAAKSKAAKDVNRESFKKNSLNKEINSEEALKKSREQQAKAVKERKANDVEAEEKQNKALEEQAQKQQQFKQQNK